MFGKKKKYVLVKDYIAVHQEMVENVRREIEIRRLILSHLNLEYVPETEKKEPAKLVEKNYVTAGLVFPVSGGGWVTPDSVVTTTASAITPKPKKRGRPKKK